MISLVSINQVLCHLSPVSYSIRTRTTSPISVKCKQKNSQIGNRNHIGISNSFAKDAYSDICSLDNLNIHLSSFIDNCNDFKAILKKKSAINQCELWNFQIYNMDLNKINKSTTNSRLLNSSSMYFIELDQKFFKKPSLTFNNFQVRYFKTVRSIKAEVNRNPALSSRFLKWIGLSSFSDDKLRIIGKDKTNNTSYQEFNVLEKFKKLQSDDNIKFDELQRIKTAFAEGFIAGSNQKPHGRAFKALKFAQQIISTILLIVLLAAIMATTGGGMFKIQLGNRGQVDPEEINITFNDVKGVEEAKSELMDVVEFLKNPEKFSVLGGKLPKGVLLVGPPGTGKTLLARAVAGEAGVPFFHAAGPEFDEVLVGQGARRVRDLFKSAKERAPCVIFIDEIDSVGAKRTNSALHPYANQTINQLLSEMDGFHQNEGVIVLGATNRRQDLDKALLRPGRFDSEVEVHAPDFLGRKEILNLYLARILTHNVDPEVLAKCTIGFTGADIENMVNQAALKAAMEGAEYVTMNHLERARDKVIMGPEGKKKLLDEEENRITAFHEGGHALVSYYTKDSTPLHKVTIIPRGQSLGHTSYIPNKDSHYMTKAQMLATMDSMMGGRAAEELIFGLDKITTGASNDFSNATDLAEAMVKSYGMSEKVGFRVHKNRHDGHNNYSTSTKELIDNEVKRILQESYERAKTILKNHSREHKLLAEALLKYETLDAEDVKLIVSGKKLQYEIKQNTDKKI